jgi:phage tail sheath protein FI
MAVNLVSPGVNIREVDLTVGATLVGNAQVAAFCGPFQKGPVNTPVSIRTEQELLNIFGNPVLTNSQNEYWLSATNYLSYGGELVVVRCDSSSTGALINSNAAVGGGSTDIQINSSVDYNLNSGSYSGWYYASRNPGSWANGLKVCTIDAYADQIISGINTTSIVVGYGVTVGINTTYAGIGTVVTETGFLKGIVTGVGNSSIDVKIVSKYSNTTNEYVTVDYSKDTITSIKTGNITINNNSGVGVLTTSSYTTLDWYDNQILKLDNSKIYWKNVAQKPKTSEYGRARNSTNDEIHIVVVDDSGAITGTAGNILEKFVNLSKAIDGKLSPAQQIYYKNYIAENSAYIFVGEGEEGVATAFDTLTSNAEGDIGNWGTLTQGTTFSSVGNSTYSLTGGTDYTATVGNYPVTLNDIVTGYKVFSNPAEYQIDFLLAGPSGEITSVECQAKANELINIATTRKDCIAVISAPKEAVLNTVDSDVQTANIINFFAGVTPSNYAVFDGGHKYTYDRFNSQFLYLPCNTDIAGLMARTSIVQYPWYSPAGANRGVINNAIKLAYNPSQSQRDSLYSNAINPIIASPGQGIILFGDKTASNVVSAFDRINVRRLFLTIENQIGRVARSQLFEFNDAITRNNFISIVEPYLRDIKAKRGITDFQVVCDESNNTPDVIDSNQFKADIYIKPARSINFINLTFVATRTGVSFSEVVGTV